MTTLIDLTEGRLQASINFARKIGDNSLIQRLKGLKAVDKNCGTKTRISNDSYQHCFYFSRYNVDTNGEPIVTDEHFRGNGGIIFHGVPGKHLKNNSVQMSPTPGWSTHT